MLSLRNISVLNNVNGAILRWAVGISFGGQNSHFPLHLGHKAETLVFVLGVSYNQMNLCQETSNPGALGLWNQNFYFHSSRKKFYSTTPSQLHVYTTIHIVWTQSPLKKIQLGRITYVFEWILDSHGSTQFNRIHDKRCMGKKQQLYKDNDSTFWVMLSEVLI